jgi:hypothetical protein
MSTLDPMHKNYEFAIGKKLCYWEREIEREKTIIT